jgi:hypothetical protein
VLNGTGGNAPDVPPRWRLPLLALGFVSLLGGVASGLARLGWDLPLPAAELVPLHGPLMASGFFGTVIGLERAVAMARRWAYLGPLATGLGGAAAIAGAPFVLCAGFICGGSLVLFVASILVYFRQRALFTFTLAAGAACWLAGNLMWLTGLEVASVVVWWCSFLVLTIAGERLELTRFLRPSPTSVRLFMLVLAILIGAILGSILDRPAGTFVYGTGLTALALWLLRQDIARRTVTERGLTRFIAVCLLSGYGWLLLSGVTIIAAGGLGTAGPAYDAALHALLLGFVFSMVFGHAAIIFPAILLVRIPYHPVFYVPLLLLHISLVVRLAGDWLPSAAARSLGGALNALALALFILSMAGAVARGRFSSSR